MSVEHASLCPSMSRLSAHPRTFLLCAPTPPHPNAHAASHRVCSPFRRKVGRNCRYQAEAAHACLPPAGETVVEPDATHLSWAEESEKVRAFDLSCERQAKWPSHTHRKVGRTPSSDKYKSSSRRRQTTYQSHVAFQPDVLVARPPSCLVQLTVALTLCYASMRVQRRKAKL